MKRLYETPIKAIRKNCLDCCCGQHKEIRLCTVKKCPLYAYRFGRRPDANTILQLEQYFGKKA